jgi:Protein of unknown function (DUF2721)
MDITLVTPAVLFPALSLILLAYTNRFHALASLIRQLLENYQREAAEHVLEQIAALRFQVRLILWMQGFGVSSLAVCVLAMMAILLANQIIGAWLFASSLMLMLVSLALSVWEIRLSANALDVALKRIKPI